MNNVRLLQGDCREVLKTLPDNSVDSIVTDPPYGLSFMGKKWDYDVPSVDIWKECLRVLKPGGHLLAFAGTRTQHRMACRIEDAGFDIRDMIAWVYGSGFPKSLDVSKAIDKAAGAEREIVGYDASKARPNKEGFAKVTAAAGDRHGNAGHKDNGATITAPATDAARQWQGWGTALKPSMEPITVARKPLIGTVADNVQQHGTGALNIDGCRVETAEEITNHSRGSDAAISKGKYGDSKAQETHQTSGQALGRWPANFIHDGSEEVIALFPTTTSGKPCGVKAGNNNNVFGQFAGGIPVTGFGDTGSAARFFYCPKASKTDRDEGLDNFDDKQTGIKNASGRGFSEGDPYPKVIRKNNHPTVKPTELMRYLCRLVTPPNGTVLDPFNGSGSTGKGAVLEGFSYIGIEREAEHIETSKGRISFAETQRALPTQMSLI